MLKVWIFIWGYVDAYGTRPNAIRYICEEGVVKLLLSLDFFELEHLQNCNLYDAEDLPVQVRV